MVSGFIILCICGSARNFVDYDVGSSEIHQPGKTCQRTTGGVVSLVFLKEGIEKRQPRFKTLDPRRTVCVCISSLVFARSIPLSEPPYRRIL